jgi:predicted nucleic acid-binding protein
MLVTDAGAWVRALFDEGPDGAVRARLRQEPYVDTPALIDLEFLSAARGLLARRLVTRGAAEESIERFLRAPIERHGHGPLAWRAWELRANLTPNDASYVALAEMLGTALLTVDRRLARAPMIRCSIELAGV